MSNPAREPGRRCIAMLCLAALTTIGFTVLSTPWLAQPYANGAPYGKALVQNAQERHVQDAGGLSEQNTQAVQAPPETASPVAERSVFNPKSFKLSGLVENVNNGNHFRIPAKAYPFLREVLASGPDVKFEAQDLRGTYACISSDLSPNIAFNSAYPVERLGQALCHELLHFQDFKQFKPIGKLTYSGLQAGQSKIFQPVVGQLVNIISHEYVKDHLEQFGYEEALRDNTDTRMKTMASGLSGTEKAIASLSVQLAKTPDKKTSVQLGNLQAVYQNLLLMTLRDQLLFQGAYASEINKMIVRFQAILDFMHQSTSEDPRFTKVYLEVQKPADSIRTACKEYERSRRGTEERYALLRDTLGHVYHHVGISFDLIHKEYEAPVLKVTSASFPPGESFLLDGKFIFSDVSLFTPVSSPGESVQLNYKTHRDSDRILPLMSTT